MNNSTANNKQLKPTALAEWTYQNLKQDILNFVIKPGEQLHMEQIANNMGVSRTPIREAFLKLATDGLVEIKPRVGYFVMAITEQDVMDLFEFREIIETRAIRKAVDQFSEDELDSMQKLITDSKRAFESNDLSIFVTNDIKFHHYIQGHIHNRLLSTFVDSMNGLTYRVRVLSLQSVENIEQTLIEHQKILDGLKQRDIELAEKYVCEHIHKVCERMVKLLI